MLGIPTVQDRWIQQAILQVIGPIFDAGFSNHSYGFRPGRDAQQAVEQARSYMAGGQRWVVDLDLEKFFDQVNHDMLMSRVARKIKDKRLLKLIRRYLAAGMMTDGVVSARTAGTPREARCRRCYRTSFWTTSIRSSSVEDITSAATPMTATST